MPHQCTACGQTFEDGSKEMLSGCPECGGNTFQYLPSDALTAEDGPAEPSDPTAEEPPMRPDSEDGGVTEAVGKAATTVRDYVARRRDEESSPGASTDEEDPATETSSATPESTAEGTPTDATPTDGSTKNEAPTEDAPTTATAGNDASADTSDAETVTTDASETEDAAQASARGEMVDSTDLPGGADPTAAGGSAGPPGEGRVLKEPDAEEERPDLEKLRAELNDQFESIRIVAPGQYELNLMELYDREEHIIALQEDGRYVIEVPDTWRDED